MHISTSLPDLTRRYEMTARACAFVARAIASHLALSQADPSIFAAELMSRGVDQGDIDRFIKGAVSAATTADGGVGQMRPYGQAFIDLPAAKNVFGRLPEARSAPPNCTIPLRTAGCDPDWVGEGEPAAVLNGTVATANLMPSKLAGIVLLTDELVRHSDPRANGLATRDLARGAAIGTDRAFLDPDRAAVAGVSPASITNGATEIPSSGVDGEALESDIRDVISALSDGMPEAPYLAMNGRTAIYLAAKRTTSGAPAFPRLTINGGDIFGTPVLISSGAPDAVVGIDAAGIAIVDQGVQLSVSTAASVEMSDAPSQSAKTGSGASTVSLYQAGLVGFRVVRFVNWARRDDAVAFLRVGVGGSPA